MEGIRLDPVGIPQHVENVRCNVKNCIYNDQSEYCTASQIRVGPSYATSGIDTICGTFRPRRRN